MSIFHTLKIRTVYYLGRREMQSYIGKYELALTIGVLKTHWKKR
jgi:hypothetical protein